MFEGITIEEGKGGGRRASSFAASVVIHGGVIGLALVASIVKANLPKEEAVQVVFKAPPPPPPPPPPPAGKKKSTPRETPKRPITPKIQPNQIIQPKEVPKELPEAPDTSADDDDEGVEGGVEGGVVGGVVGGVLGGVVGGTLGGTLGEEGPPQLLGSGMSRPQPSADCRPAKPVPPEQARQMGITGLVLVEYVVHSDGHVGEVVLKNPTAPPILFEAVKSWLLGCPFTPSLSGTKPIAVKIIQPFTFKPGQ